MPRTSQYDQDQILDAALRLCASGGPEAVTVPAITRAIGVPSGSVYYRFSSRTTLMAELWLRSARRFSRPLLIGLASSGEPGDRASDALVAVLRWVTTHVPEAGVALLHERENFAPGTWPDVFEQRAERLQTEVRTALEQLAAEHLGTVGDGLVRVRFALLDLPAIAVRSALAGTPRSAAVALIEEAASALLEVRRPSVDQDRD